MRMRRWARVSVVVGFAAAIAVQASAAVPPARRGSSDSTLSRILKEKDAAAGDHLSAAVTAARQGAVPLALREVDAAIAADPKNAEAYRLRAALLLRTNQPGPAVDALRTLVELRPQDASAWFVLGQALRSTRQSFLARKAADAYAEALRLDPALIEAYGPRAELLAGLGDKPGVEANHKAWLAQAPDDPDAYTAYARALWAFGDLPNARSAVDRSLEIRPTWPGYTLRAGLRPAAENKEALADAERAVALTANASTYLVRASMHARLNETKPAMADVQKALELFPSSLEALALRAGLYERDHQYALAIADLDRMVGMRGGDVWILNERCWTRAIANIELDLALADCDAGVKADPKNGAVMDSRAFVRLRKGDYAGAIRDYDAALAMRPNQAPSLFGRGIARLRAGDKAGGDADLAAARKLAPEIDAQYASWGVKP